ncbi:MAG: aminopeptidase P family protein [Acidobacteria bacterium]|jgi:Xaa-Pro aminopeptidase|nr:MAG: aminopeptidase P family protein [Acidobacteriota bacterium]
MAAATRDNLAARHLSIRDALTRRTLDALVVTSLPNIFYLTGFSGTAGIFVLTATRGWLLTDFRYVAAVQRLLATNDAWPDAAHVQVENSYDEALAALLVELGVRRIGFEATHLSVSRHQWLSTRLQVDEGPSGNGLQLVPTEGVVERVRVRKDAHEIATLRAAANLLSEVARDVLRTVQPGPSERELAAVIDYKLKSAGFARPAFDTIVAAGSNAALPHARPGGRRLHTGDLVLLDFGGVYDGYCVDLTRTVCLGRADDEMHRVYDAVAQAQRAALAIVAPGVPAAAVDAAARMVLADRGLGEAFGHGLGHGLGVEVHEAPRVAPRRPASSSHVPDASFESDMDIIAEGMVFTIEPGAYLPGWGGVRLEDDVLVTADGCEVLTDVPRELQV